MKKYLLILIALLAGVANSSPRITGEQLAACAGDYFTAGMISAQQPVDDDKIYYTLLAYMTSEKAAKTLGYDKSNEITANTIVKYIDKMEKNQDVVEPLVANINKCDKLVGKTK